MNSGFQTFGRLAMAFVLIGLSFVAHGGATMRARPFVKWAGGKGQLLEQLDALLPNDFAHRENLVYVEPFVGGAAMLFHVLAKYPNIKQAVINDANSELVATYKTIKTNPEGLIGRLFKLQEEFGKCATEELRQDMYLKLRDKFNMRNSDELEMSSLFIFLNKTCFNGLYRVNSNGEFNVPFGKAKSPTICDADNIRALNKVLQKVTILNGDFENVIKSVKGKAFFYFDPPYRPLTQSAALGKTDEAWNKLFHQYNIPERVSNDGSFLITADQIKEYREPRLMAKFDHRKNLPAVFQEHELGILPISRGDYVIGPYKMFFPHPDPSGVTPPDRVSFPGEIESVTPDLIASEAVALNCAWDSRILHRFLGEDTLYPTLSGRMGANPFSFNIQDELGTRNSLVSVDGAQIEVDAAYEGTGSVAIIEAKMNLAEDFIVRQLYYPFRHFMSMHISKPIRTVYLTYSDGKFHLAEYAFANPQDYNSLSLVKSCSYIIGCASMPRESLLEMLEMTTSAPEPKDVPFPQADTFERVINLCERLASSPMSKEDIEECYGFDRRQADYYYNAAAYLGFAKKESGRGSRVVLTPKGRHWTALPVAERIRYIVWCILCHEPFRRVLRVSLSHGTVPECEEIRNILIDTNPSIGDVQGNTFARRASTVRHWTQWIMSHMDS